MVTKMEKFTQKNYEELRATLSELYMHPGIIVYKDDEENKILEKLYNWFNNNTYGDIEFAINIDKSIEQTLHTIYIDIQKIKEGNIDEKQFKIRLAELNNCNNKLENTFKDIDKNKLDLKNNLSQLLQFLNIVNNSKITIRDLVEKINQYNVQADKDSNDLTIHKKEALTAIERERSDFLQFVEDSKKLLNKTQKDLLEEYNKLKGEQNTFKKEIYQEVNDIKTAVNREKLAAYFLNERKKLKGDINIPLLLYTTLLEISFFFIIDIFTEIWQTFTFFKIVIFLAFSFIIIFLLAKFGCVGYYKIFGKDMNDEVKVIDELKALLTPYWCWLSLTFFGMLSIFIIANEFYTKDMFELLQVKPFLVLTNLPFFMILVWFTWFCSKQFSYTKQICDEYEYKYALSKSYLGYRAEAKELADSIKNSAILVALLDSVIKNIATSPVKSVKPDCHTPFTKVFNSIRGTVDVVKDGKDFINK